MFKASRVSLEFLLGKVLLGKVFLGALLLAGGLTACAGGAVDPPYHGTYDPSMLRYIAGKGALYTQIVGNPFSASKDKVERVVTGTMFGAHFGPDVRFSTKRDPDNTSPYSVVLLFNPAPSVTAIQLCAAPDPQLARPASGQTRVMLAFCASGSRESSVTGRISGVTDPDDPAFRGLIRQMTGQLFPPKNPDPNGGGKDFNT